MQAELTNKSIIHYLKGVYKKTGFIDGLKIRYRSLICPFISLIQKVKPGERVGDVGCGSGQFLLLLKKFAQPGYVYGIEISKRLIDNAKDLFGGMPGNNYYFSEYDGRTFPAELGSMDVIFLIDVLHHVPRKSQESFIKVLAQTMKPGARLILKDINAANPLVYFNKLHDLIFAREIGNEMSLAKAIRLLTENGLTIVEQEKRVMYVYPHYTIVATK